MRHLHRLRDGMMAALVILGGTAVLALMAHVVIDVASRNLSNRPIPATFEIVTHYYMIALAFIPLAWVEKNGGMVQVEILESFLTDRMRHASDIFVALFSAVVYGALAWVSWGVALKNLQTGTFVLAMNIPVPTWPAYFMLPAGFALAALVVLIRAVDTLSGQGDTL